MGYLDIFGVRVNIGSCPWLAFEPTHIRLTAAENCQPLHAIDLNPQHQASRPNSLTNISNLQPHHHS
jgi:hypothetical protein